MPVEIAQPKATSPCPSFLKDFVDPVETGPVPAPTFISAWLESVGSDRERRCRSDGYIAEDDPIPRHLTRSAPEMGHPLDADGFAVPATPSSARSRVSSRTQASGTSLSSNVRHASYRELNLNPNQVYINNPRTRLPDGLSEHLDRLRAKRDSPGPSPAEMDGYLDGLARFSEACTESEVEGFLTASLFPGDSDATYGRRAAGLKTSKSSLMSSHLVPNNPQSRLKVSQPKPDLLYGYSGSHQDGAFTPQQLLAQQSVGASLPGATAQMLRYPFFAIEFKAAGGTAGDLWVAANQCAGASAACLNAVAQLNARLPESQSARRVDNLSYAIALDNNTAQLFISWKEDDLSCLLQRVGSFLLDSPDHFREFRSQVRNILDWGKGEHLTQIREALEVILEENRKQAAERARGRPSPSEDGPDGGQGKMRRPSCGSGSGRSGSVQAGDGRV